MSTPAQRLQWQWDEDTLGIYADPSPEELDEVRDDEFRHWDTFTFARTAGRPSGAGTARERGVTVDGELLRGAPKTHPAHNRPLIPTGVGCVGGEVTGSTSPPGVGGLANPSVQRWMWTP